MSKDFKENKRGCFIIAALVAAMVALLAYGILWSGDDPRSNGITPSGTQSAPATGAPSPGRSEPADPEV